MSHYIHILKQHQSVWIAMMLMLAGGMAAGIIGSSVALIYCVFFQKAWLKEGLILILFTMVFLLGDNFSGRIGFANNLRFVVLGISLFYIFSNNLLNRKYSEAILPYSIIAVIVTLLYSPLEYHAILRAIAYWLMALVIFSLTEYSNSKNARSFMQLIILSISLYIFVNILFYFFPSSFDVYLQGRFRGIMHNPNGLGLVCLLFYPFNDLARKRYNDLFPTRFYLIIKAVIVILAILTGSRNTVFSIIIYELAIIFGKNKGLFTFGLSIVILSYYSISMYDIISLIQKLGLADFLRVDSLLDASGRTEVWKVAWQEVKRSPWLGNGMMYDTHFIVEYGDRYLGLNRARHWYGIWNSYLSLLLNVGIVGLAAYAWFIKEMYKNAQLKNLAFAFLVMSLFSAITESWMAASMNAYTPLFFLYWAVQAQPIKKNMVER